MDRREQLLHFVQGAHGQQVRKYTGEPYVNHLIAVAEKAQEHLDSMFVYEIAICHDLLEDTTVDDKVLMLVLMEIGYEEWNAKFICDRVLDLTDVFHTHSYPDMNRALRKKYEAMRLGNTSPLVQSIKYADLIDNTKSIVQHDPGFAKVYLKEKKDLLDKMRRGNIDLLIEACSLLHEHLVVEDI